MFEDGLVFEAGCRTILKRQRLAMMPPRSMLETPPPFPLYGAGSKPARNAISFLALDVRSSCGRDRILKQDRSPSRQEGVGIRTAARAKRRWRQTLNAASSIPLPTRKITQENYTGSGAEDRRGEGRFAHARI